MARGRPVDAGTTVAAADGATVAAADGATVALGLGVALAAGVAAVDGATATVNVQVPRASSPSSSETVVHWTRYEPEPSGVAGVATICLALLGSTPPVATVAAAHELDDEAAAVGVHAFDEGARHHRHGLGHGGLVGGRRLSSCGVRAGQSRREQRRAGRQRPTAAARRRESESCASCRESTKFRSGQDRQNDDRRCAPRLHQHQGESLAAAPPGIALRGGSARRRPAPMIASRGGTIVANPAAAADAARTLRSRVPTTVPDVTFSDERLANGLRVIVAEDHLAPVVAVNLWYDVGSKHEVAGQDRLRAPLRARDVPGLAARRQGRAHRARPGRRRDDERLDLARPHQLLRDAAGAPARPGALARGRPDGDPARRAQPGEPRQPARGRQEREALVVRQPAVRLVPGEAPGPPLPGRSTRTTTRRSARWRTSTRPRSRTSARSSGPTTRPNNAVLSVVGDVETAARPRRPPSATSGPSRPTRTIPPLGDLSLPADARRGAARDRLRPGPAAARLRRVPGAGLRRPAARRARPRRPDPGRRQGQPAQPAARPRRADRPGRRAVHASGSSAARRSRPAGRRSGPASPVARVEAAFHRGARAPDDRARSATTSWPAPRP